jgi:hypothetical protein
MGANSTQGLAIPIPVTSTSTSTKGLEMGANSTQGVAIVLFLVGFTFLAGALFTGGGLLYLLLFAVCVVASIGLFLKCKPSEHRESSR